MRDLFTRALQDLLISLDLLGLLRGAPSSQDLYERSLYKSSLQDLFTRPLWEISKSSLHKTSMRDLCTRALCTRSPDIPGPPGLFTGALYKISSQDLYEESLYKSSLQDLFTRPLCEISSQELSTRSLHRTPIWDISLQDPLISLDLLGLFTGALYQISSQDLFTRPLWEISVQELSTRSLHKTSMRDLYTRAHYKISSQDPHMRDLFTRALPELYKISSQDPHMRHLCTRALYKISSQDPHLRHLYTRSPDIPGPPRSLHRSSLQDLFTRPPWEISIQELSPEILGPPRSFHSSYLQDLFTRPICRDLGLFTGALYKISSQDLCERSLYKISWYPWTSEISSLQDLFKTPRSGSNTQKVPRGLRGRNQNRHRATARAIRHARTPQRVARAETKHAPGWAPATFHQQNEHGATARAIRHAQSPEKVAFANIKPAPRHSETQKFTVPTAPWRQNYNTKCDFSMFCDASIAPATKKWVRGIRSPVTATRNDVNIADPNSTTVSQNEHFELSKTDFKSTKYCACHEKWRFFTTSNFEQPLRRFCTPLKTLTFCTFPDFRKSTRRAGENAPPKWTSQRPRLAQAKCIFSISRGTFQREGRQKSRTRQRTPPIYTRCFSITVRTP